MRKDTPDLVDLVAAGVTAEKENVAAESQGGKSAKRQRIYEDHRPVAAITAGIKRGIYHQAGHATPHHSLWNQPCSTMLH